MDEVTKAELARVEGRIDSHESTCEKLGRANVASMQELKEDVRDLKEKVDGIVGDLTDRVKLMTEMSRQQNEAIANRMNTMMDDINRRQSNTATSIINSVNQTVMGFKDLMEKGLDIASNGVSSANNAVAAFMHSQAETNKMLAELSKVAREDAAGASADAKTATNRVWQLGSGILAAFVLIAAYLYIHKGP